VRAGVENLEAAIPLFVKTWEERSASDLERPRDERVGVPGTLRMAFEETVAPAVEELTDSLARQLGRRRGRLRVGALNCVRRRVRKAKAPDT
jgi:hypothetical protein